MLRFVIICNKSFMYFTLPTEYVRDFAWALSFSAVVFNKMIKALHCKPFIVSSHLIFKTLGSSVKQTRSLAASKGMIDINDFAGVRQGIEQFDDRREVRSSIAALSFTSRLGRE